MVLCDSPVTLLKPEAEVYLHAAFSGCARVRVKLRFHLNAGNAKAHA